MLDILLWNKIARIVALLATRLDVDTARALSIFYKSNVCRLLHDERLGLHLMSDAYIVSDIITEIREGKLRE